MSLRQEMSDKMAASEWGRWFDLADAEAMVIARGGRGGRRSRRHDEGPPEVVALLALADLREMVLELAGALDALGAEPPT